MAYWLEPGMSLLEAYAHINAPISLTNPCWWVTNSIF